MTLKSSNMQMIQENGRPIKQARAPRLGAEAWAANRTIIEQLYLKENQRLRDVIDIMKEKHNFDASRRQYEYHLALWKVGKYTPRANNFRKSAGSRGDVDVNEEDDFAADVTNLTDVATNFLPPISGSPRSFPSVSDSLPTILQDDTFDVPEQVFANTNDKGRESFVRMNSEKRENNPFSQFSNCQFTNLDGHSHDHHYYHHDPQVSIDMSTTPEHLWQPPRTLSRLLELETPAAQRTYEQYYRVQKLMWCLWLCGNQDCFVNLAMGVQYRIVRVEDDLARFESSIEAWIDKSTGCPSPWSPSGFRNPGHDMFAETSTTFHMTNAQQPQSENGINRWQKHAAIGHHLAVLKATGKTDQAQQLALRLAFDLRSVPGRWAFFSSFAILLRILQRCLVKELGTLRALEADVRDFIKAAFEGVPMDVNTMDTAVDEKKAVGVLSYLCYQRWRHHSGYTLEQEAYIEAGTGFPISKAFQWLMRLLIYHSRWAKHQVPKNDHHHHQQQQQQQQPTKTSLAPSSLCSRALNGLSATSLFENAHLAKDDNLESQVERFATVWLDWLSRDSEWFLAPSLPNDLVTSSVNVWQAIPC